jgi:hypothetical protein
MSAERLAGQLKLVLFCARVPISLFCAKAARLMKEKSAEKKIEFFMILNFYLFSVDVVFPIV